MGTMGKMGRFSIFASSPYPKVQLSVLHMNSLTTFSPFLLMSCLQQISFTPLKSDLSLQAHFL